MGYEIKLIIGKALLEQANAETLLIALRRTNRRKCRSGIIAACILFSLLAWAACIWLTRHFLP